MLYDSKSFLSAEALRNGNHSFTDKNDDSSRILKSTRLSLLDTIDFFNFYKQCKPWQSISRCKNGEEYISGLILPESYGQIIDFLPRTVVKSDKDRKCDFISDCDDNSDEENCDISCPVHFNVSVSQQESSHISGTYTQTNDTINNRPVWRREGRQQWLYYSSERLKWLFATIQDGSSSILHSFEGDVICPHLSAGWIFLDKNKRQYS